jgi:pantoate--beta-alanine ligase
MPRHQPVLEPIETISRLRAWRSGVHDGTALALVPTMGALHAGHAALVAKARRECGVVAVSIFVNPLQFDSRDDLARYPRTLEADIEICRGLGVDVVFAPASAEVYPQPPECSVDVGHLADHLCGPFRPGHFRGVATVVLKLFQIVQPHRAYFGEKDAQQLAIIRRLVVDFDVPVSVVGVQTVREADGLAMSSRNRHLSAGERRLAVCLYQTLVDARRLIESGERRAAAVVRTAAARIPRSDALKLEYLEIVAQADLQPVDEIDGPVLIAGALWVGSTRLIDNVLVEQ